MTLSPTYRRGSLGVLSATARMSSLVIQHVIGAAMDLEVSTDNDTYTFGYLCFTHVQ